MDKDAILQSAVIAGIELKMPTEEIAYFPYHRARLYDQLEYLMRAPQVHDHKSRALVLGETIPWSVIFFEKVCSIESDVVGDRVWWRTETTVSYRADLENGVPEALNDKRYDIVVACEVLEHIQNVGGVVVWLGGHVNAGGRVLVSCPYNERTGGDPHHKHYQIDFMVLQGWFGPDKWECEWSEVRQYERRLPVITAMFRRL